MHQPKSVLRSAEIDSDMLKAKRLRMTDVNEEEEGVEM